MPPEGRGSLKWAMDRLVELEQTIHPQTLNVYRWWRPDMALPAVWNWMTPGDVEPVGMPACNVRDTARITVSIGIDPTAVAGHGDMLEVEEYLDLALDAFNRELYGREPLGQREARRRGIQTVADRLGDAYVLTLELPIEVVLDRPVLSTP